MKTKPYLKSDVEALIAVGKVLYGERWQTDLARDLKLSDARRIRQWVAGERNMPTGIRSELAALLRERARVIRVVWEGINAVKVE